MFRRSVSNKSGFILKRCALALAAMAGLHAVAAPVQAQTPMPVTVGAGLQTSFVHTSPNAGKFTQRFMVNSARLYVNGPVADHIKFMFNTEYNGSTNEIGVLDAVARIEVSPQFNIWAGRLLPPSDRANLYGPYYAHHWAVFQDGVQDGYPFLATGRDNGVVYWGDFAEKVKISVGAFDGTTTTGNPKILTAARIQIDFWDPEGGYYLNGTYYGGKNLLAIGAATQVQSNRTASTIDFLMEKKLSSEGVVSLEAEYSNYNRLGGYDSSYAKSQGGYVLGSYLFPTMIGPGKFEVLGKYAKAQFTHGFTPSYQQKTTELNFNYVIKEFNARVMTFYKDTRFNTTAKTDFWQLGVGLQIQM